MLRATRFLILVLVLPTGLLPVRLDLCLACLFGQGAGVCVAEAAACCGCCRGAAEDVAELSPCCRQERRQDEAPAFRPGEPEPADCCLHIDNDRDELPAPEFRFELPTARVEIDFALLQSPAALVAPAPPPLLASSGPPPETPLPLLI